MSAFLSLTEQQKKALFAALSRKDVFTILSTGHVKCIIFQLLPAVCKYLSLRGYSYPRHAIILVVCPLKSLVDSHIRELRNRGARPWRLGNQFEQSRPGGALGYFLGGYVPPGTPNWHPVLEKISRKIDTPF